MTDVSQILTTKSFEEGINQGWAELEGDAMDPDTYAKTVVPKVIEPKPRIRSGVELEHGRFGRRKLCRSH